MSVTARVVGLVLAVAACSPPANKPPDPGLPPVGKPKPGAVTLTIVGTNDLHGALSRLPILGGYLANLRAARAADGGGVVLVDAGDMFQGTLESNIAEGADVVKAYNALRYDGAAVGNHEFDFGPEGPAATPKAADDDARGALKARAAEAKFPMMSVNLYDKTSGSRIKWPNMPASRVVEVAGIKVGIIGASTESTPFTTMPANVVGLEFRPAGAAITEEARRLRSEGVKVIVVTAHIGSRCKDLDRPNDTSSCDTKEELFDVIGDLPAGLVDVFVAGHTHAAIAHRISDIAVIESFASGRAFGRVDLRIAPDGHVTSAKIHKPHELCANEAGATGDVPRDGANPVAADACRPGDYEGKPVVADAGVQTIVDAALERARLRRDEKLGVKLLATLTKSYGNESAEGNLFTDLMLAATSEADVAVTNGGGLRADIPSGELTYGGLFEANPFDNRFAVVDLEGRHIKKLVTNNLQRGGAILSWGGLVARARCKGDRLDVAISVRGRPLVDGKKYKLVTSDFLASGGDGLIGRLRLPDGSVKITDTIIREAMVAVLKKRGGTLDPAQLHSPLKRRLDYEGTRPVECGKSQNVKRDTEPPD